MVRTGKQSVKLLTRAPEHYYDTLRLRHEPKPEAEPPATRLARLARLARLDVADPHDDRHGAPEAKTRPDLTLKVLEIPVSFTQSGLNLFAPTDAVSHSSESFNSVVHLPGLLALHLPCNRHDNELSPLFHPLTSSNAALSPSSTAAESRQRTAPPIYEPTLPALITGGGDDHGINHGESEVLSFVAVYLAPVVGSLVRWRRRRQRRLRVSFQYLARRDNRTVRDTPMTDSQIILLADPDSFASLTLVNSKWRRVSQQAHLYAHHLSKCPSYAACHAALSPALVDDAQLPKLRRLFAREIKRNLFQAYLRPSETRIKLISNSISSASCPGGEGLRFSPSPRGHHLLAYNSSRIYVIDVRGPASEICVKREFKILRRPVAACIKDDATLLAVLSMEMQVDIFDLQKSPPKRVQSVLLDHKPRTIALSPCGSVLAAAYEGGIEVSSLSSDAITGQRAVKCDAVDSLAFSPDGTQLLGTTTHSPHQNTVILTAPYYDPGSHMAEDNISALWTTSILFPNSSRDCSHAILIQDSENEEASWTFTYDRSFETFRAVRIGDLRNGTTYFTGPLPKSSSSAPLRWKLATHRPRVPGTEEARLPKWQVLCDNQRNTLISGQKITELEPITHVKWVTGFGGRASQERLVVMARGVNGYQPITEEEDIDFVDGGIISLLDFDCGFENGQRTDITIDVGTDSPEILEEEQRDIDAEVALVRRRTVAQRRGGPRGALQRMATTPIPPANPRLPPMPNHPSRGGFRSDDDDDDDPLQPRRIGVLPSTLPHHNRVAFHDDNDVDSIEEQEALDAPYTQANPRSVSTLRRAATAAAMNQRLRDNRFEYRRADGRREHPHESDADNWVPPPPPYQKDAIVDLPAFLRHPAIPPGNPSDPRIHPLAPRLAEPSGRGPESTASRVLLATASPLSDTFSDARFTVSTMQSPTSATAARYWDEAAVADRRLTQSPVSDSAAETYSARYSIRGPYSDPLALNPPFGAASGASSGAASTGKPLPRIPQRRQRSGTQGSTDGEAQSPPSGSSRDSRPSGARATSAQLQSSPRRGARLSLTCTSPHRPCPPPGSVFYYVVAAGGARRRGGTIVRYSAAPSRHDAWSVGPSPVPSRAAPHHQHANGGVWRLRSPDRHPSLRRAETPVFAPTPRRPQPRTEPGVPGPSHFDILETGQDPPSPQPHHSAYGLETERHEARQGASPGQAAQREKRSPSSVRQPAETEQSGDWVDEFDPSLDDKGKDKKCIIM
ncbi:unnamed protein product [Parascedosporium putredinis]|uniref:DUF7165 domain-containing protein n=1 Tax=Parascedosporium putredinis TaxID=1442378 RepID=A0A9P1H6Z0_9PEZI|nr:unnamed protein product [Parascedosporium putredinis]CAI7998065.1 unnamed protein product [Parascedosporium putredinis]